MDVIIQSLIVAGITAAVTSYVNGKVLERVMEERFKAFTDRLVKVEDEVKAIRTRLRDWAPHIGWVDQQRRSTPIHRGTKT